MLRVEEARDLILRYAPHRRVTRRPLEQALGLILAEDLSAPEPLPTFARSAMDGYALRAADTQAATRERPVVLGLAGIIPAGHPMAEPLQMGMCASIMTGAPIPVGADAVIRKEEARVTPEGIQIHRPVAAGENVAPIGEDVVQGQPLLKAGHKIRPAEVNLLAALGMLDVPVFDPPRVGILCTGDELVPAGDPVGPGQIRNSNGPCLSALVRSAGCVPISLGMVPDVAALIAATISQAEGCEMILTSGGVSVGDFDVVREALTLLGAQELFWRVAIKPGTPVCAFVLGERLVIGLSGNPAAAITNFDLLVRPLLDTLCGRPRVGLREAQAVLDQPVLRTTALTRYLRARVYTGPEGELRAEIDMPQRSGILSSMVYANAYVVIPARMGPLPVGECVKVVLQDDVTVMGDFAVPVSP